MVEHSLKSIEALFSRKNNVCKRNIRLYQWLWYILYCSDILKVIPKYISCALAFYMYLKVCVKKKIAKHLSSDIWLPPKSIVSIWYFFTWSQRSRMTKNKAIYLKVNTPFNSLRHSLAVKTMYTKGILGYTNGCDTFSTVPIFWK